MNRREVIQAILAASAGSVLFTGCAKANVVDLIQDGKLILNQRHTDYLAAISESILPIQAVSDKIETPADFILRMLNDCRSLEDVQNFALGFDQYKALVTQAKSNISDEEPSTAVERIKAQITSETPQDELLYFLHEVKSLSIQNLKTSSFYLTQKTDYQLIPQAYQACTDA